jgi:predicted ArsR family transcriptional regulator
VSQDQDRSQDRILFHLKTRGPQVAADVGSRLDMTPAGARQHLLKLEAAGLVESEDQREGRGRPRKYWRLTQRGHERFPDRHSDLTLDLLRSIRDVFGDEGRERLIEHRERATVANYRKLVGAQVSLRQKLAALARIRSREGYMASVAKDTRGSFLLIENHCPICAAATACQGLCRSELAIFRAVLGTDVTVERIDHILAGARRCAYRIARRKPR